MAADEPARHTRDMPTPVVTVCSLTEPQRTAAAGSVLIDLDHGIQLSFDLDVDRGLIRRRIHDLSRIVEDTWVEPAYACLSCSLRDEVVRSVLDWADRGRPIVLALPPTTEPAVIVSALAAAAEAEPGRLMMARVLAVVDSASAENDVFGDDLLDERGIADGQHDRRSVGEVVCHQLECADVIGFASPVPARTATILDHLAHPSIPQTELHRLSGAELLQAHATGRPQTEVGGCSSHLGGWTVASTGAIDADGVWTVELRSERPFSPDRLRAELEALAGGRLRGRGYFWLPTRPELRCVWDGAGGQLSIGPAGVWADDQHTALVITGTDGDPARVRAAFERAILTDAEFVAGPDRWATVDDGMDPWLGVRAGG